MSADFRPLLRHLLRTRAPGARDVVLYVLLAQLLASGGHDGPPHPARRPPRRAPRPASRTRRHESLTGRRPRG